MCINTANPHLMMLAILSAGLQRLDEKSILLMKDPEKIMLTGFKSQEAAGKFGVKDTAEIGVI
jgi:hypothetical protein